MIPSFSRPQCYFPGTIITVFIQTHQALNSNTFRIPAFVSVGLLKGVGTGEYFNPQKNRNNEANSPIYSTPLESSAPNIKLFLKWRLVGGVPQFGGDEVNFRGPKYSTILNPRWRSRRSNFPGNFLLEPLSPLGSRFSLDFPFICPPWGLAAVGSAAPGIPDMKGSQPLL